MAFIAHNPSSSRHDMQGHPETAARAAAILSAFDEDPAFRSLPRVTPDRAITRDEALRTHSMRLWHNLETIGPHLPAHLDPDTYVVDGSVEAALSTGRLSMLAAERAMRLDEPGYVVARPPGHHATQDRSMGFCLLNNVAIAAGAAMSLGARRVLIFDHDVHHGNGTQDIFYGSAHVLYQSFHLTPHYPGTGQVQETGSGVGQGYTVNAPLYHGDGEPHVRSLLQNVFVPVAKSFRPELVLFSSGYDSLEGDPLGGLRLRPGFFGEMVRAFQKVCPRIVCFLEGGYQLDAIPLAASAQLAALVSPGKPQQAPVEAPECEAPLRRALSAHWPQLA